MRSSHIPKAGLMLVLITLVIDLTSVLLSIQAAPVRNHERSLTEAAEVVASPANPLTRRVESGLEKGAGNVKAAVQNLGAALDQAANGVADVGGCATAGLGQTVGKIPRATSGSDSDGDDD
ncbi:hypothetical protein BKA57DRAFT_433704 [Linnemannia elongata]|nr:hypothetical protein BKA57DRAFT_433704 [Linnemannia elongata]